MKNGYTRDSLRRLASLLLAAVVAVSFMPFLGEAAYAEDMDGEAAVSTQAAQSVSGEKSDTVISDEELADMEKQIEDSLNEEGDPESPGKLESAVEVDPTNDAAPDDNRINDDNILAIGESINSGLNPPGTDASDEERTRDIKSQSITAEANYNATITQSGNTIVINAPNITASNLYYAIWIDRQFYDTNVYKELNSYRYDMSSLGTGYHSVAVIIFDYNSGSPIPKELAGDKDIPINTITATPTYAGRREVYSNYLNIYPYNMYFANEAGPLYMEFSRDGGKNWGNRYKLRAANLIELKIQQGSMVGGLSPNTTYQTRLRYGISVTYDSSIGGDDKDYLFFGPALYTGTIKTGKAKKPKIKSVTCKAVKVKYHKIRWPGYWNVVGGVAFWHKPYTEKYYTYKVKVTIKLKKKPGTKGLWVSCSSSSGEKFLKGNKKKYTTTFTPTINYSSKKPKGHVKVKVSVRSGQSKTYGGYSPYYTSKRKKLK